MSICDSIRQGDTNPKYAVTAIKKKFYHSNPHVALYALQVMESCVKNCGILVHEEISNKQFMEELRDLVKQSTDENIKTKVLELLQTWGMAFRNSPKYRIVTDTLNLMKAEGWKFPPVREAEAMFEADTAPEWKEGDVCHRCRVQFTTFTRQHHCRACGQVFCGKCSSKSCVLPKFGIEREVRVCDSCFDQFGPNETLANPAGIEKKEASSDLPAEYLASPLSKQPQEPPARNPGGKTEAELKEEEELQLVLALSKSEAEEKEKEKKKATSEMLAGYGKIGNGVANEGNNNSNATTNGGTATSMEDPKQDSELEKYLNRDYWEKRERQDTGPVASAKSMILNQSMGEAPVVQNQLQKSPTNPNKPEDEDLDEFTGTLRTQLEIFVNRMKSNSSRGRPISNDSSVQTLFMNIMTMHGKLVRHIQEQEESRVMYEGMQDRLSQIRDARAALDALREEELERKRREQEELERQRQAQLAAKLEVMRKKKAEYLEYQRQIAMQRMAEQEREIAKMAEANKVNYQQQQQGMYNMYMPYGYPQPGPGMIPNHGMPPSSQQQPGSAIPPPGQGSSGPIMSPPVSGQPAMTQSFPGQAMSTGGPNSMMPPQSGAYPGYPYGQPSFQPPPEQSGHSQTQGEASASGHTTTTTSQSNNSFNMNGLAGALPPHINYMGQQAPGHTPHQTFPPPHGPPMHPEQMMTGTPGGVPVTNHQQEQQQPVPQPDAPSESLIVFD